MLSVAKVLNSVLNGNNNFCCLCLNNILHDSYNIHDKINVKLNNADENLTVFGVLQSLFSHEINEKISEFENLCCNCLQSAIESYKFIQNSKANSILLTNAMDSLTSGLEYTKNDDTNSKSLYILYDTEHNYTKHIYDNYEVKTPKMAAKRFHILNKPKIELPFKIAEENKTTKTEKMSLKDMLYDPNDKSTLRCKWCLKVFSKKWILQNHYLKTHASKEYKCTQCLLKFCSKLFLKTHEDESHTKFTCSKCGKFYKTSYSLKSHEKSHDFTLVCPDCGRVYRSKRNYKTHIDQNVCKRDTRANPSDAKYTCDYCNKKYTQKVSLRVHIQFEHGNHKAHICEWCGKKFWAQSRLQAHIVTHTKEKKFTCSICNGKFVTKEALLYHTRLHTGEKPYKCAHCTLSFLSASRRSMHMKKYHTGACLQCDICSSTFNSRMYLEKHRISHFPNTQLTFHSEIKKINYHVDNKMADSVKSKGNSKKDSAETPMKDLNEISEEDVHNFIYQLSDNVDNDVILT